MKQYYSHYETWEDYQNGMYCLTISRDENQIKKAKKLLTDIILFRDVMYLLIKNWPISTKVNLTNKSSNRRAWLGAAACSYKYDVTEINTRHAWAELNDIQRFHANTIAEQIINQYERENSGLHKDMGSPMLF